jgi:drug/metabolite transporter (DMT)-like permease
MKADLLTLGAVLLWATLASLATLLSDIPPFLLTGIGLLIGAAVSLPALRSGLTPWKIPVRTLLIGVYGLFGYHFMLFLALQTAPAVEANLVNYLWPLLIVLLSPLFTKSLKLNLRYVLAALSGFAGAVIAITYNSSGLESSSIEIGYLFALAAAVIWATYSLATTKVASFPTASIGLFALVSGLLALGAHFVFEPAAYISSSDWVLLVLLGAGPLGGAFYLWDAALKIGDPRRIGLLAFLTPLLSTVLLVLVSGDSLSWQLLVATALIVGGAMLGSRTTSEPKARAK